MEDNAELQNFLLYEILKKHKSTKFECLFNDNFNSDVTEITFNKPMNFGHNFTQKGTFSFTFFKIVSIVNKTEIRLTFFLVMLD